MAEPLINNSVYLKNHITERKIVEKGKLKTTNFSRDEVQETGKIKKKRVIFFIELELNNLNSILSQSAVTPVFLASSPRAARSLRSFRAELGGRKGACCGKVQELQGAPQVHTAAGAPQRCLDAQLAFGSSPPVRQRVAAGPPSRYTRACPWIHLARRWAWPSQM